MWRGGRARLTVERGREGSEERREGKTDCGKREGGMCGEEGEQD